jgi:hypothetical protein
MIKCVNCGANVTYQTNAFWAWRGEFGSTICGATAGEQEWGHQVASGTAREILAAEKVRFAWQARN